MGTYPVTDMLIKIKNGGNAKQEYVDVHYSRFMLNILNVLKEEGYIKNTKVLKEKGKNIIRIFLKYSNNKKHTISGFKFFSTPGRRMYCGYRDIPKVRSGIATVVLTTPGGVISDRDARRKKLGGEVIFAVW
jgi:small subunit ribosomal protein S8